MSLTLRFGFRRFGGSEGGSITDDGSAFSDADRITLDKLLTAFEYHDHKGGDQLPNPVDRPVLTLVTTAGQLAPNTTYYYRVGWVDQYGLETVASDEVSITTPGQVATPNPPILLGASVAGTLVVGLYRYAVSANQGTSVTPPSVAEQLTLDSATTAIELTLPDLPTGADSLNVFRFGPHDSGYTRIATLDPLVTPVFVDNGSVPSDPEAGEPDTSPPLNNTTTTANSVVIQTPQTAYVSDPLSPVKAWRVYRTLQSGIYGGQNLVGQVVTLGLNGGLRTTLTDDGGGVLDSASPKNVSQTLKPSVKIQGGGGGGATLPVPGDVAGTYWVLYVTIDPYQVTYLQPLTSPPVVDYTKSGVIDSRRAGTGAAGTGKTFLISPNGTIYRITVDATGIVGTVTGSPGANDIVYLSGAGPVLPVDSTADPTNTYRLGVADDGAFTLDYV